MNATKVGLINIAYTTNNTDWNTIATNVDAALGSYTWTLPQINSTSVKVKITSVDSTAIQDISNAVFSILFPPSLQISTPNGGEVWYNTATKTIRWNAVNVRAVSIEYTINDSVWNLIGITTNAASGLFSWTLPRINSTTVKVRITSIDSPLIQDVSNATFSILTPPSVQLISPNGGEVWFNNTTKTVSWSKVNVATVSISYTTNDTDWNAIASNIDASLGSYTWTLPKINSTRVKVKVLSEDSAQIQDISNGMFSILTPPSVKVLSPNGGEVWYNNLIRTIEWNSINIDTITIAYSTNDTIWNVIAQNVSAAKGSFAWLLPQLNATQVRVKITSRDSSTIQDVSDAVFSILTPPSLQLISPNGGEVWANNTSRLIEWNSTNVSKVDIEYSTNNVNWNVIATNVDASLHSYIWTLPGINSIMLKLG